MSRPRIWAAVIVAVTMGCAALGTPALAHDELLRSSPGADAVLPSAPPDVTLLFSAALKPEAVQLAVVDAKGNSVRSGEAVVDGATVKQALKPDLPAGEYRISYRVISRDGHPVQGVNSFTVQAAQQSGVQANPAVQPGSGHDHHDHAKSGNDSTNSTWLWILVVGVVVIAGVIGALVEKRRRARTRAAAPSQSS